MLLWLKLREDVKGNDKNFGCRKLVETFEARSEFLREMFSEIIFNDKKCYFAYEIIRLKEAKDS
jgi:hypothetical protein